MASLKSSVAVFFAVLCCCSALSVPSFCKRCKLDVNDPRCQYCCAVNSCCKSGIPQEHCVDIQCSCTPVSITSTITPTTGTRSLQPPVYNRECRLPSKSSRILGGSDVSVCERPWMVRFVVKMTGFDIPACSGILISPTQILTSQPCINRINIPMPDTSVIALFADSDKYLETKREVDFKQVVQDGDIAIVNFSPKVQVDEGESSDYCIRPVCLPDAKTVFTEDAKQKCKTASWGYTNETQEVTSETLQESSVSLMCSRVCKEMLPILDLLNIHIDAPTDGGICTSPINTTSSTCDFDQGGMLLCQDQGESTVENWMLAGIAFGTPCDINKPSTFVNVTKNLEFINTNLK